MQTLAALRFACAWGLGLAASSPRTPAGFAGRKSASLQGLRVPAATALTRWVAGHRGRRCEGIGCRRGPGERASNE